MKLNDAWPYSKLPEVAGNHNLTKATKIKLVKSLIFFIFLYAAGT